METDGDKFSPPTKSPLPEVRVFAGKPNLTIHTIVAVAFWLGSFHFLFLMVASTFFFLPLPKAIAVCCVLALFVVIPIDEKAKYGRKLASYICRHGAGYFPMTLHIEDYDGFDPNRSYVFGYEPHSVFPIGSVALSDCMGDFPVSKIKLLASSAIFYTPFLRHIWTWMGLAPATRKNFASLLASGHSCIIVPGGAQETVYMERKSEVAFIMCRKGFVRLAIQNGCPVVPVFSFGQSQAYKWWKPSNKLCLQFSRTLKFTPIVFWGFFGTPFPFRVPMHIVVGRPIEVKKSPDPTAEEISEVHGRYVEALKELFERHKGRVGHPDIQLKIL